MDQIIAGLGSRVFLMNNTHEDVPVVFQTRWSLSYLRGPLTRTQIKQLMDVYKAAPGQQVQSVVQPVTAAAAVTPATTFIAAAQPAAVVQPSGSRGPAGNQPALPADIPQFFVPLRGNASGVVYKPMLVGGAKVRFSDAKNKVDLTTDLNVLTPIVDRAVPIDWSEAVKVDLALNDLDKNPAQAVSFADLPAQAAQARSYTAWSRDFTNWAYGEQKLELLRSPGTGVISKPDEPERDFRVRLAQSTREQRDDTVEALRKKYAPKIAALQEKIRRAQQAVDREAGQAKQAGLQTAISVGATLLGAFMGRKVTSRSNLGSATTAFRGVGRTMAQSGDIGRCQGNSGCL